MKHRIAILTAALAIAGAAPAPPADAQPAQSATHQGYLYKGEAARRLGGILRRYYYCCARGLDVYWDTRFHDKKLGGFGSVYIDGYLRCGRFYVRELGNNSYWRARWSIRPC